MSRDLLTLRSLWRWEYQLRMQLRDELLRNEL
jgi:hypothetical protein